MNSLVWLKLKTAGAVSTQRHPDLLSGLLLLFVTLLFFWRAPLQGRVLLPLDVLYTYEPWRSEVPGALGMRLWNPWLSDEVRQFYPLLSFIQSSWRAGELPLWSPHALAGMPVMASGFHKAFYPITVILLLLMPTAQAMSWGIILHTFLGAVFCFLFIRELGAGRLGAMLGALGFIFNGSLVAVMPSLPRFPTIIWLPLLFFAFERALKSKNWFWVIVGGLIVAIQISAGQLQIVLYSLTGLGLYAVYRGSLAWWERRSFRPLIFALAFVGFSSIIGMGLTAFQLWPLLELTPQGVRVEMDSSEELDQGFQEVIPEFSPKILLRLFIPDILGTDIDQNIAPGFTHEMYVYFGLLPLLFLSLSFFSPYRRLVWGMFGIGLLVWLVTFKVPPFYQLFETFYPSFRELGFHRAEILIAFFWAVAAGLGADWVVSERPAKYLRILIYGGLGFGVVISIYLLWLAFINKYGVRFFWDLPPTDTFAPDPIYQLASLIFTLVILAGSLALLWGWQQARVDQTFFGSAVLTLLLIDLFLAHLDYLPALDESMLYPRTPSLEFMLKLDAQESQPYRLMSIDRLFWGDIATVFQLDDVQGYHSFLLKRYSDYLDLTKARMATKFRIAAFMAKTSPLLDALNIKYYYIPRYKLAEGEWVSLLHQVDKPLVQSEHGYAGHTAEWIIAGWPQEVILAPTYSKISYQGLLQKPSQIETAIAIAPEEWERPDADVLFEVYAQSASSPAGVPLFSQRLNQASEMKWQPVVVDLSQFTNQNVVVSFVTSSADPTAAWNAGWAHPLLMDSSKVELLYYGPNSIYLNKNHRPRAWVVHHVVEIAEDDIAAAKAILADPTFDLATQAVIEGHLVEPLTSPSGQNQVEFVEYAASSAKVKATLASPGVLVMSDVFYPGWQAYVNGSSTPIYATNLMMRGIYLPAGTHDVEFIYEPTSFRWGLYISAGILVLVIIWLGIIWKIKRT
jgi:hypothetical protein